MPFIKQDARDEIANQGLEELVQYLNSVDTQTRKGFVAYAVMYLARYSFLQNYFGASTALDSVRSAYDEMYTELRKYEAKKKDENGGV